MRKTLAWLLFYVGHVTSLIMKTTHCWLLYPIYNRFMLWSSDIQGLSDNGPWSNG